MQNRASCSYSTGLQIKSVLLEEVSSTASFKYVVKQCERSSLRSQINKVVHSVKNKMRHNPLTDILLAVEHHR
jgi:hypothetical protein